MLAVLGCVSGAREIDYHYHIRKMLIANHRTKGVKMGLGGLVQMCACHFGVIKLTQLSQMPCNSKKAGRRAKQTRD